MRESDGRGCVFCECHDSQVTGDGLRGANGNDRFLYGEGCGVEEVMCCHKKTIEEITKTMRGRPTWSNKVIYIHQLTSALSGMEISKAKAHHHQSSLSVPTKSLL